MNLVATATRAVESLPAPDFLLKYGVKHLVARTSAGFADGGGVDDAAFTEAMDEFPIAVHTDDANTQHYELPPEFFELVLGPRRKYSCCLYKSPSSTLSEAEELAIEETCSHAELADGQAILELGCGWGSLSLFMAARFPKSRIVSVSNSTPQRLHIEEQARKLGLDNLTVVTADMNVFQPDERFDRIVSVEMFEHMSNWRLLLGRARSWLRADGRMFIHVFSHRANSYRFDHADKADWIAQHFFTGGIMPSHGFIRQFADVFKVEQEWQWNGQHYERTALDWLRNFDAHSREVRTVFDKTYGRDAMLWMRRWRLFFLATAGLFGYAGGNEWGVSHYLLRPTHLPSVEASRLSLAASET